MGKIYVMAFWLFLAGPGFGVEKESVDLVITHGWVITVNPQMETLKDGAIAISDNTIVAVGQTSAILDKYKAPKTLDARGALVIPGLVNTHTHAAMTLFRGFSDDVPLKIWLEKYLWPAEAQFINAKTVRVGTELAIAEMIRSGTTTFNDMYFFMDEVGQAAEKAGIRAVIGESLIDFPTPNAKTPDEGLAETRKLIPKWKNHPLVQVSVAAHAPYSCSPELIQTAYKLAEEHNLLFHIHLSETQTEVDDIKKRYGRTPVAHLNHLGVLSGRVIGAHCVVLSDDDVKLLARTGAGMSHNPESNMKLASGAAPIAQLLEEKVGVGLGTDGAASNNDLDMFEAMDSAAKLQKFAQNNPSAVKAHEIVRMATLGGAEVLGLNKITGSLEPGKRADLVMIPLDKPHLVPIYNPYSHLVFSVSGSDVGTVMVDGQILFENGVLTTMNEAAILEKARRIGEKIRKAFPAK